MTRTFRFRGAALAATLALTGVAAAAAGPAGAKGSGYTATTIATGLNNPRGITMGPDDRLYVAEAGLGSGNAATGVQPGLGNTGSITVVRKPAHEYFNSKRIVTGLPSAAMDEGNGPEAIGPAGLYAGGDSGNVKLRAVVGAAGIPNSLYGHAIGVRVSDRKVYDIADVGSSNLAWTAQYQGQPWAGADFPDSNPYGINPMHGVRYVVDAGSNTLNRINKDGTIDVLAYFPGTGISDAVPTCVTEGPDGALYIGTLALADFFVKGPGTATVYRVDVKKTDPDSLDRILSVAKPWATGFSTITGCTFDDDDNFYAAEMFTGDVAKVPFKNPTARTLIGQGTLTLPNGVAVSESGKVYVTNLSSTQQAGAGSVVRFVRNK